MTKPKKTELDTTPNSDDPSQDRLAGIVAHYLTPIYKLVNKLAGDRLNFSAEFWAFASVLVLLVLIKYFHVGIDGLITTLLVAIICEFLWLNIDTLKRLLPETAQEKKRKFIEQINEKSFEEVKEFLSNKQISLNQLKTILLSKHNRNNDLYLVIGRHQRYDPELLEFIVERELDTYTTPEAMSKLVGGVDGSLNKPSFKKMLQTDAWRLKGALAIKNPEYILRETWYQKITFPLLRLTAWLSSLLLNTATKLLGSLILLVVVVQEGKLAEIIKANSLNNPVSTVFVSLNTMLVLWVICLLLVNFSLKIFRVLTVYSWGAIYRTAKKMRT